MLKYVIIRETDGAEFAFFTLAPVTHLELALSLQAYRPGRTVVSAGFATLEPDGRVTTHGRSDSLNLAPRRTDADYLTIFTRATATAAQASIAALPQNGDGLRASSADKPQAREHEGTGLMSQ